MVYLLKRHHTVFTDDNLKFVISPFEYVLVCILEHGARSQCMFIKNNGVVCMKDYQTSLFHKLTLWTILDRYELLD